MQKLSLDERKTLASKAAKARWDKAKNPGENASTTGDGQQQVSELPTLPVAMWPGELTIGIACYVLYDGRRMISRTGAPRPALAWHQRIVIAETKSEERCA